MNGAGLGSNVCRTLLDCQMHKLPSSRKYYQVQLILPLNGIPFINYHQASSFVGTKRPIKTLQFGDLLFADKKHDTSERFAFSIYTIDKTITFIAQDETMMNEWLSKIRELHSNLYPEFKRYDTIFEANLLDKDLARTMKIQGHYRLALCRESFDLMPLLNLNDHSQSNAIFRKPSSTPNNSIKNSSNNNNNSNTKASTTTVSTSNTASITMSNHNHHHHTHNHGYHNHHNHHHHLPQPLPSHQRFCKRHPMLASKTIELVWRNIRRCGHTDSNFYIELGRQSQIGEGGLWMSLNKKSTARQLHELSLAAMKQASTTDEQFLNRAPRSRSGSSSDNANRSQQSRSSSLVCLNSQDLPVNMEEDSGYLHMA